jgi:hypothetical protein
MVAVAVLGKLVWRGGSGAIGRVAVAGWQWLVSTEPPCSGGSNGTDFVVWLWLGGKWQWFGNCGSGWVAVVIFERVAVAGWQCLVALVRGDRDGSNGAKFVV